MYSEDVSDLRRRLAETEQRLYGINERVSRIERALPNLPAPEIVAPQPPPVVAHPRSAVRIWPKLESSPEFDLPIAESQTRSVNVDDIEYKIGLTGLLRGGAVIVVLGLLYLVALGISRGWITLQVQFIGELLLCLGFIGLGIYKRTEREEFGQLLTGIGSCGLYFSFGGAHVYKHLFEGEVLVSLFLVLSLANLGYSLWQSSRTFLIIGLLGGLIGSMLPMKEDRALLTSALHFLILVPSAAIIVRNNWRHLPLLLWGASSLALLPVFFSGEAWAVRLVALYGSCLVAAYAYGKTHSQDSWDPYAAFIPFVATFGAIGGLLLDHVTLVANRGGSTNPAHGSWQVLILSALCVGLGYLLRGQITARNASYFAGLALAVVLSPIGLNRTPEAFVDLGIACVLALACVRLRIVSVSWLGWVSFGLAMTAYVAPWSSDVFLEGFESAFLIAGMVGVGLQAWSTTKLGKGAQVATTVASLVIIPMVLRMAVIWTYPVWGFSYARSLLAGFALCAMALLMIGRVQRWTALIALGCTSLAGALLMYWVGFPYVATLDSTLVLGLASLVLYAAYASQTVTTGDSTAGLHGVTSVTLALLLTRLANIGLAPMMGEPGAVAAGLVMASLIGSAVILRFRLVGVVLSSWATVGLAVLGLVLGAGPIEELRQPELALILTGNFATDITLILGTLAAVVLAGVASKQFAPKGGTVEGGATLLAFPVWTVLWQTVLVQEMGMKSSAAMTVSWIAFSVISMAIGFVYRLRALRLWSFGAFGLTVAKVLLLDLAYLDAGIRVVILLALGIAMIAGGYWYIRTGSPTGRPQDG